MSTLLPEQTQMAPSTALSSLSPYLSIALLHFSRSWQLLRAGSSLAIFLLPLANPSPLSHASRLPHLPFQSIPSTELTRRNSPEGKKCNWYFSHPPFPLSPYFLSFAAILFWHRKGNRFSILNCLAARAPDRQPHSHYFRPRVYRHFGTIPILFVFHFGPINRIGRGTRSPNWLVRDSQFNPCLSLTWQHVNGILNLSLSKSLSQTFIVIDPYSMTEDLGVCRTCPDFPVLQERGAHSLGRSLRHAAGD